VVRIRERGLLLPLRWEDSTKPKRDQHRSAKDQRRGCYARQFVLRCLGSGDKAAQQREEAFIKDSPAFELQWVLAGKAGLALAHGQRQTPAKSTHMKESWPSNSA